jgi:hypothetical protein
MKNKMTRVFLALALLALSALNSQLSSARAQGTAFTYQGHLVSGTNAANGNFDLTFELFAAAGGGSQTGATLTNLDVGVTNGLFTVTTDFGAVFNGAAYWLQIGVRTNGGGSFTALSPRQELTPTPYSITAENVTGAIALAQLPAGLVTNDQNGVTLSNVTVGGSLTLPAPATIDSGGNSLLFDDSLNNFYAGLGAGVVGGSGGANTGIGYQSLNNNTNGTNNTALGYQSLNDNTNGSYNVAIGERALFQNTSGNDNTAEGRHALENNTTGADNTANGYQALLNNRGSYNVADGSSALSSITGGSYNIALGYLAGNNYGEGESSNILIGSLGVGGDNNTIRIGNAQTETYIVGVINGNGGGLTNLSASQISGSIPLAQLPGDLVTNNESGVALDDVTVNGALTLPSPAAVYSGGSSLINTEGSGNFFAGFDAGNFSLNGAYNTGVGYESLVYAETGSYNTGYGAYSLLYGTTGSYNTGTGAFALSDQTAPGAVVGSNNTANGAYSLFSDSTGYYNTAVGASSLYNNESGFYNTAIGYNAGYNITGNSNIDIGHPGVAGENMTIRIGNGQTETYIAGVINGDGSGLSNILGGSFINNTGGQSFFAGQSAGNQTMTGAFNTGVGDDALSGNTAGGNNTALGFKALWQNTNGSGNTSLGSDSMAFNTSGSDNTGLGLGALEYNTTGSFNTGTGAYALSAYNTAYVTGNDNTADGAYALGGNESGFQNTGVGYGALADNTTGSYNTAAGAGALGDNTASYNAAFGAGALSLNTSGADNLAVGADALAFNSTGSDNTATGYGALALNTSGNNNTANGYNAMGGAFSSSGGNSALGGYAIYEITTGYNNTAAGYDALEDNSTGVDNVGIGVATFQLNETGSANTACGTYAFQNMTVGNGNIGLGMYAGYDLSAGTNNIYIGNYGSANDNEIIRIGQGQTETYISGSIQLDGADTNNGLTYVSSGLPGISAGNGPFLFGYNGGALGGLFPTTICLSWDYSGDVWVSNNCSVGTLTIRGGSDLAEPFKMSSGDGQAPEGSVMVIDEQSPGRLKVSSQPYDTRVAGILSGANGIHPGIQMQQEGALEGGRNVALSGRVYVQADASNGPIYPGDLLTTSSTPGRAMKVTDHLRAQGAILGKAMSGLSEGNGMVLVLVTLQ